jgi:DNA-binding NarL/FixJ family response regulator
VPLRRHGWHGEWNYTVLPAAASVHGESTLSCGDLRAEPFDVVLLDVLMPEVAGYETRQNVQSLMLDCLPRRSNSPT